MAQLVLGPMLRYVDSGAATVWVETDEPCEVEVLGSTSPTFSVGDHHYTIVLVDGLEPGRSYHYDVRLDGRSVWPAPESAYPAPVIRTPRDSSADEWRLVFASCRVARPHTAPYTSRDGEEGMGIDALHAYARTMLAGDQEDWPHALLFVGDQVYADEVSPDTLAHIRATRGTDVPPGEEVANFEEYTLLYREAWSDPVIRWLLATVPTVMIFDDHDVHDDWNTSAVWRRQMQATSWWQERITGGLMSYWLYQHLGNLTPTQLQTDPLLQQMRAVRDGTEVLREFAQRADREADGGEPVRWSFRRDFAGARLLVIDSRCGRVLRAGHRAMADPAEWAWLAEQVRDSPEHLVIASSLPVLLPPAIHGLESWDEAVCDGVWGKRWSRWGEKIRQGADLEHWAAFRQSFVDLTRLAGEVGAGRYGTAPASITFLGGDVHFSYVAQAHFPPRDEVRSVVHQLVCSPMRNPIAKRIRRADRLARTRVGMLVGQLLLRAARVPPSEVTWGIDEGPWFDNQIATLTTAGTSARFTLEQSALAGAEGPALREVCTRSLT